MLRAARFGTKFLIGILIALVLAVAGLAVTASPHWIQAPIAEAVIATESPFSVCIPGSTFSVCESGGQQERCQVQIAGQPLTVTVFYANNSKQEIVGCQSFYQSRSLQCSAGFDYAGAQLLPSVAMFSSLGLSQPQLQSLRTRYWLAQWTEPQWFRLTTGLSVTAALLTALAIGLSHQKNLYSPSERLHQRWHSWLVPVAGCSLLATARRAVDSGSPRNLWPTVQASPRIDGYSERHGCIWVFLVFCPVELALPGACRLTLAFIHGRV